MAKVKALFFLPRRDNDGRSLVAEIKALELELYVHFVGWTLIGEVKGMYKMADGSRATDKSNAYMVVPDESRIAELEALLRGFKAKTSQEAIYLEIQHHVDVRYL